MKISDICGSFFSRKPFTNNLDSLSEFNREGAKYYDSISISRELFYDWLSISGEFNYTKNISNIMGYK